MASQASPLSTSKFLASSPRFHSHFFEACIGCVPVGVRKSDGRCNLNADLTAASFPTQRRSAHYTQSPELGEPFQNSNLYFMPLPLCCPCGHARVRIPLPSPTACAAAPPVSERPPPAPVSSRSYHLVRPVPIPSVVDCCPDQKDPECDARTAPAASARTHPLPL